MDHFQTYTLLARCLALDFAGNHRQSVIDAFESQKFSTEKFVKMADGHLVLQTLYLLLEKHDLISHISQELAEHLKMVFDINTARNEKILEQVVSVNSMLSQENITPVYLKGTGNILDGLYSNPGERILHDIDFLVEEKDFDKTVEIFLANAYHTDPFNISEIIKSSKHYPILHKEGFPVSVEIHRLPVRSEYTLKFSPEMVFRNKIKSRGNSGCFVMSDGHKAIHIFIHSHLEDNGYLFAKTFLRSLYDLLLLSNRVNLEEVFSGFGYYRRKSTDFLDIMYKSFGIEPSKRSTPKIYFHFYFARYRLNIRYRLINIISTLMIKMYLSYIKKPVLALTDKELRKSLIGKLKDRNWYGKHFGRYRKFIREE